MMGGTEAHEFMVLNPAGEDTLVLCDACGYAANQQIAIVPQAEPPAEDAAADSRRSRRPARRRSPTLAAFLGHRPGARPPRRPSS